MTTHVPNKVAGMKLKADKQLTVSFRNITLTLFILWPTRRKADIKDKV